MTKIDQKSQLWLWPGSKSKRSPETSLASRQKSKLGLKISQFLEKRKSKILIKTKIKLNIPKMYKNQSKNPSLGSVPAVNLKYSTVTSLTSSQESKWDSKSDNSHKNVSQKSKFKIS